MVSEPSTSTKHMLIAKWLKRNFLYLNRRQPSTVTITDIRVDSVYLSHYEKQRGDTILVRDTILKYKILHDIQTETLTEYVHDSIPYPVEVVKEVRKRNGYDKFTSRGFWILVLLLLGRVAWWVFKTFYLKRELVGIF